MSKRKIEIEHNGKEYIGEPMVIERTTLGYEDHGIFTFNLHCSGKGSRVSLGNMFLDTSPKHAPEGTPDLGRGEYGRYGTAYGLDAIIAVIDTVGVQSWEALKGEQVLALFEKNSSGWGGLSVGVANILDEDKVLIFREHAEEWLNAEKNNTA